MQVKTSIVQRNTHRKKGKVCWGARQPGEKNRKKGQKTTRKDGEQVDSLTGHVRETKHQWMKKKPKGESKGLTGEGKRMGAELTRGTSSDESKNRKTGVMAYPADNRGKGQKKWGSKNLYKRVKDTNRDGLMSLRQQAREVAEEAGGTAKGGGTKKPNVLEKGWGEGEVRG